MPPIESILIKHPDHNGADLIVPLPQSSRTSTADESPKQNQVVLMVTCVTFSLFVVAEIVGALASNSLSLLGDAAAMSVDVFTYFCNMWAERMKSKGRISMPVKFLLEVYIPLFSIMALIAVSIWILTGDLPL
jgi:Co/Zn/Cd efflux system component